MPISYVVFGRRRQSLFDSPHGKRKVRSQDPPLADGDRSVSFLVSFMFVYLRPSPSTTALEQGYGTIMVGPGRSSHILKSGWSARWKVADVGCTNMNETRNETDRSPSAGAGACDLTFPAYRAGSRTRTGDAARRRRIISAKLAAELSPCGGCGAHPFPVPDLACQSVLDLIRVATRKAPSATAAVMSHLRIRSLRSAYMPSAWWDGID